MEWLEAGWFHLCSQFLRFQKQPLSYLLRLVKLVLWPFQDLNRCSNQCLAHVCVRRGGICIVRHGRFWPAPLGLPLRGLRLFLTSWIKTTGSHEQTVQPHGRGHPQGEMEQDNVFSKNITAHVLSPKVGMYIKVPSVNMGLFTPCRITPAWTPPHLQTD